MANITGSLTCQATTPALHPSYFWRGTISPFRTLRRAALSWSSLWATSFWPMKPRKYFDGYRAGMFSTTFSSESFFINRRNSDITYFFRCLVILDGEFPHSDGAPDETDMERVFIPTFVSPLPSWIKARTPALFLNCSCPKTIKPYQI